jgi:hypothetical protein
MQAPDGMRFVTETPELHASEAAQAFVKQEIERPSKVWVQEVVRSDRESEFVKLRTGDFVLLPDLNGHRRQVRAYRARVQIPSPHQQHYSGGGHWRLYDNNPTTVSNSCQHWRSEVGWRQAERPTPNQNQNGLWSPVYGPKHMRAHSWPQEATDERKIRPAGAKRFNWLAIVADPSLRSIRDLRGEHVEMLEGLYADCMQAIQKEYKSVAAEDVMVFANYPPSVYKLHFHFCAPFFQPTAYDAFRMHSLRAIINNLRIHPDYYKISTFQIAVHSGSDLYRALVPACVRRQLMITNGGADGGDDNGSEHDEKDEFNE